eukprot:g2151.t1
MICSGTSTFQWSLLNHVKLFLRRPTRVSNTVPTKVSALLGSRPRSLQDYGSLKGELMKNLVFSGSFFTFYLSATQSLEAGAASFLGACGSYVYMKMLIHDVDNLSSLDQIPISQINKMEDGFLKKCLSVMAYYQQALTWRLLPLISLGVLIKFSDFFIEGGMSRIDQGYMLLGFLSYKIPLLLTLYDSLKPNIDEEIRITPPRVDSNEDFDIYGRKKTDVVKKLTNLNE